MALPVVQTRPSRRFSRVLSFCCIFAALLSLCSCSQKPSKDPNEKMNRLNLFLDNEGVERIPAKGFKFPSLIDATELLSTTVATDLTAELSRGKNVVYCATYKFAKAFENRTTIGQGIPTSAEGIADELPAESYRILDGTPEDIRSQLAEGFPSTAESLDFLGGEEQWWCCHFQRSLPFLEAFERLKEPLAFQSSEGTLNVACFGDLRFEEYSVQQTLRKEQIAVIDFQGEDDFIVRLNTVVNEDELILAKVHPDESLESTLESVMRRVKNNPLEGSEQSEIRDGEALVVPMLTVNLLKWFSDMPPGFQTIRFRLDERGAELDSFLGYSSLGSDIVLRQMVFDKPFLLYLKSKTAEAPYFVLWVENLEVMEEFSAETED